MVRALVLAVVGLFVGAIIASTMGAVLGFLLGAAMGGLWAMLSQEHRQTVVVPVEGSVQRVICIPHGRVAECKFEHGPDGIVVDVVACSHFSPDCEVSCEKNCLKMVNDATLLTRLKRTLGRA